MKQKMTGLEMLRLDYQRREEALTEPYKAELREFSALTSRLRSTIREMERVLGSDLAQQMVTIFAEQLTCEVRQLILAAAAKNRGPVDPVTVTLPADVVRFYTPNSIDAVLLRHFNNEALPNLQLSVDPMPMTEATVVDIRIPPISFRYVQQHH